MLTISFYLVKGIYKQMMSDKRYGLTVNILATKVLPALTPVVVSPNLKLDEVRKFCICK